MASPISFGGKSNQGHRTRHPTFTCQPVESEAKAVPNSRGRHFPLRERTQTRTNVQARDGKIIRWGVNRQKSIFKPETFSLRRPSLDLFKVESAVVLLLCCGIGGVDFGTVWDLALGLEAAGLIGRVFVNHVGLGVLEIA